MSRWNNYSSETSLWWHGDHRLLFKFGTNVPVVSHLWKQRGNKQTHSGWLVRSISQQQQQQQHEDGPPYQLRRVCPLQLYSQRSPCNLLFFRVLGWFGVVSCAPVRNPRRHYSSRRMLSALSHMSHKVIYEQIVCLHDVSLCALIYPDGSLVMVLFTSELWHEMEALHTDSPQCLDLYMRAETMGFWGWYLVSLFVVGVEYLVRFVVLFLSRRYDKVMKLLF